MIPKIINFSGGRSSAMMLYVIKESLGPRDRVIFANTGKEMEQTLNFVHQCQKSWDVPIVWLEFTGRNGYKVVNYSSASRNGEPFEALITMKNYLPNPIARFCTEELKVKTMERYLKDEGITEFEPYLGIRFDEPRRFVRMRETHTMPLVDSEITRHDVHAFWQHHPFDLALPNDEGVNNMGNCDLCMLKGHGIKQSIINMNPASAQWWADQERRIGGTFRSDQPNYKEMQLIAKDYPSLPLDMDAGFSCFCGD